MDDKLERRVRCRAVAILREMRGWIVIDLAAALGVKHSLVSNWERGMKVPERETLERITAAAGFSCFHLRLALEAAEAACCTLDGFNRPPLEEDPAPEIEGLAILAGQLTTHFTRQRLLLEWREQQPVAGSEKDDPVIDRREAEGLCAILRMHSPEDQRILIEDGKEYRGWAVCERLAEASAEIAASEPKECGGLAGLALFVAERLPGSPGRRARASGWAMAFLGNAARVMGEFNAAEAAFRESQARWNASLLEDLPWLDESRPFDLEASFRSDQRRFSEALQLLDQALAKHPPVGQVARIFLLQAGIFQEQGDFDAALLSLRKAAAECDPTAQPQIWFGIRFNQLHNLHDLGRHTEAEALLPEVRALAEQLGLRMHRLRLRWLEAHLAEARGQKAEALAMLREIHAVFWEEKDLYEIGLVTLEIAVLLLDLGQTPQVKTLAQEIAPLFATQGVQREAFASVQLFVEAAEKEALTSHQARRLLEELRAPATKRDG
jgi:transcriptional regulator with XRE-family HTH domain